LIAAAHAGCFSMALTAILGEAGFTPTLIHTVARVHIGFTESGPTLTRIELETTGEAPGVGAAGFQQHAEAAKKHCLVSRALAGVGSITLKARLVERSSPAADAAQ
jgi:osmotically inducible protein OsmC